MSPENQSRSARSARAKRRTEDGKGEVRSKARKVVLSPELEEEAIITPKKNAVTQFRDKAGLPSSSTRASAASESPSATDAVAAFVASTAEAGETPAIRPRIKLTVKPRAKAAPGSSTNPTPARTPVPDIPAPAPAPAALSTPTTTPAPSKSAPPTVKVGAAVTSGEGSAAGPSVPLASRSTPKQLPPIKKGTSPAVFATGHNRAKSAVGADAFAPPASGTPVQSLLASTLSQLHRKAGTPSKADPPSKSKTIPKIEKVAKETTIAWAPSLAEQASYEKYKPERLAARARRAAQAKNGLNLNYAKDAYKVDSTLDYTREINLPGSMGVQTTGVPERILSHLFGVAALEERKQRAEAKLAAEQISAVEMEL